MDNKKIPIDSDDMISLITPRVFISNSPTGDLNFSSEGVLYLMKNIKAVYDFLGVPQNIIQFNPPGGHDF